jgi:hypothetical protein
VQVAVSGEDEAVATSYIRKEMGICPVTLDNVEDNSVVKGYVSKVDANKKELQVDIGVFEPVATQATIPLSILQAQLANGKDLALKKLSETYGLAEGLPITVKVSRVAGEAGGLRGELSVEQVAKLQAWQLSLLDRLIVLGADKELIDETLERTRLSRDVIEVEKLGLFEYALTCKLGTEATGLIPKIGRYMRYGVFVVFSARRSSGVIGEQTLTL